MSELTIKPIDDERVRFQMSEITVDGIESRRTTLHSNIFFSLKDATVTDFWLIDAFDYRSDREPDMDYFMKTGKVQFL